MALKVFLVLLLFLLLIAKAFELYLVELMNNVKSLSFLIAVLDFENFRMKAEMKETN